MKSLKMYRFDPEEGPSNTYVATLLPFGSVEGNIRERFRRAAQVSGYTILAAHAPGTGKPYLSGGRSLWSLWRSDLNAVASRLYKPLMDAVQTETEKAEGLKRIIVAGDSGRTALTAAVALHEIDLVGKGEIEKPTIQAVLGRDGALLEAMPIPKGATHLLRDGGNRVAWSESMAEPPKRTKLYAGACSVAEMASHAWLMSGIEPRRTIERLAEANVPFHYVSLTRGLAGSADDCRAFNRELEERRDAADVLAPIVTELRDWAHGDLMWPEALAQDLIATAGLAN